MNFKKPKISKKKIIIFSVFVVIATIFWFLNALNKEYITKIEYPVEYFNFPENIVPAKTLPEHLVISLKAYGYDILWKINISNPVKIDIKKNAILDKTDKSKLLINTNKFADELFPKLTNFEIISIHPELIVLSTKKIASKKVPLKPDVSFLCKPLYMQSGEIKLYPDSIMIYGAKEDLSKIEFIKTKKEDFKDLNDTLRSNIKLVKIIDISYSSYETTVEIPVEKYTENTTLVSAEIINCPDSLKVITFPKEIKITYKVTLSNFNKIGKDNFLLTADYNDIKTDNPEKVQIKLNQYPVGLQSIKLSPEYVDYIIEKEEEKPPDK